MLLSKISLQTLHTFRSKYNILRVLCPVKLKCFQYSVCDSIYSVKKSTYSNGLKSNWAPFSLTKLDYSNNFNLPLSSQKKIFLSTESRDSVVDNEVKKSIPLKDGYIPIYKFKYIVHAYVLCRLKIFQTALVTCSVPFVIFANEGVIVIFGLSSFAILMLCVMGEAFRKFVGIVYYHPKKDAVCISHLTFWGQRQDSYFDIQDIVPLTDSEGDLSDIYLVIRTYSDPKSKYWLTIKYGEILDKDKFYNVFGHVNS